MTARENNLILPDSPSNLSVDETFKQLQTQKSGLTSEEVAARQNLFGLNHLTAKKKISALKMYIEQFKNNLILILIASTFLILFIYFFGEKDPSDLIEAGLIGTIILMITGLGFFQEYKAEKSIEALKKLLAYKAKVYRDGGEIEVDVTNLVPGDVVILEEGEKVPADIRLTEVFNLKVNEASLTGESTPVSKFSQKIEGIKLINDQENMVFSATTIAAGRAIGIVVKTGDDTEIGKIARDVAETTEDKTPIQVRLDRIGKIIGYIILGICAIVFVFIVFFANDFTELSLLQRIIHSFIAAVALAVAAIPEGLPAVVTISLALGTRRMLRKNALIRKLNSVETLGSVDVICSDKTGTLTKGEMTVKEIYFDNSSYEVSGVGYEKKGKILKDGKEVDPAAVSLLLQVGLDCNNAQVSDSQILGDPTEAALIISAYKANVIEKSQRILEIPFSSERKMMSVVVKNSQGHFVFTKGAPEIVLAKCAKILKGGKEINLEKSARDKILNQTHQMSSKALRTLGFAYKKISPSSVIPRPAQQDEGSKKDSSSRVDVRTQNDIKNLESDLVFIGLQGMIDPARVEIKPLVTSCYQSGIRIIMITGDHVDTARAIAADIGLKGEALTGEDLDRMTDEKFKRATEKVSIYARVNPGFKTRIIDSLKKGGHIVAMTGDGVNDAPALKKSDIGIAMGITGTDVTKEASDMVLLDDNFGTIVHAIEEGRGIFHNIRKFVTYLLSSNIGEVMIVFFGVMFLQKLPLTATMILWINVVTDGIPAVALGLDPAEKDILRYRPAAFQNQIISRRLWVEMFILGSLLTIFTLPIYILNLPQGLPSAQAAAFTAIVIFELVNLFLIRSAYKTSFFSNKNLFWATVVTILIQIAIVYIPFFSGLFGIGRVNLFDWVYIIFASVGLWITFKLIQKFLDRIKFVLL